MIIESTFSPAWWLFNCHLQTIWATLTRNEKTPIDKWERFELPDGDFIDLSWAINGLLDDTPLVILLHGLGGNQDSTYIAGQMHAYNKRGWRALLMHFRGASKEPNRLPRAYHSGDTADLNYLLQELGRREPNTKKALVGISLGGNVLLKWLGENPEQAIIHLAVAVSVPFQLNMVADRINKGFSRFYQKYLLKKLRQVFKRKLIMQEEGFPFTERDLDKLKCFWTFDEQVTAKLHGFSNVHSYYREASSKPYLININIPTLIIHAIDDPFMTPNALPKEAELSPYVTLELSRRGGHVGFITGSTPGKPVYWLDKRIPEFLYEILE